MSANSHLAIVAPAGRARTHPTEAGTMQAATLLGQPAALKHFFKICDARPIEHLSEADAAVAKALALAAEHVSFAAVCARLVELYSRIGCPAGAAAAA